MNISGGAVGVGMLSRATSSPFTVSQWQELEHQSLIFKFLVAGVPVPPELVLPIQKSLQSLSARFFQNNSATYCSYYGKKVDPEPGRCRRTDGKKWRCSKDAHPDSKYCERHMHRGRNRSRKPVELQNSFQTSSTLTAPSMSEGNSVADSFQNLTFQTFGSVHDSCGSANSSSQLKVDSNIYGITNKDYRYNLEGGGQSCFDSENVRGSTHPSLLNYQQQQQQFFASEVDAEEGEGQQPLRRFFDKWP